ncbi:MAG: hypothetical protein UR26_C0001G0203 [candidate division TM6 bacterium GW2011_GWF2_32_72]|nr:MAG: hypothetical protein UR26_C0001G0203 [candidate division TM6 bacterium GW2011_GWF2_32_72]
MNLNLFVRGKTMISKKKFFFTLTLVILVLYGTTKTIKWYKKYSNNMEVINMIKNPNPQNTIIAFDLHGVLLERDDCTILKRSIKELSWNRIKLLFTTALAWDMLKLKLTKANSAEQWINELAIKYPALNLDTEKIIDITNEQYPKQETVDVLEILKSRGYKLFVFSNIGENSFKGIEKKFPKIFKNFDGEYVCKAEDDYISKPNPKAYENFLKTINNKYTREFKYVIFVDDRWDNIKTAKRFEQIKPIGFLSAEQLEEDLTKTGVL